MGNIIRNRSIVSSGSSTVAGSIPLYGFKTTITSNSFSTIGSIPINLIVGQGANKIIVIKQGSFMMRKVAPGSINYNFPTALNINLVVGNIINTQINFTTNPFSAGTTCICSITSYDNAGQSSGGNQPLMLTTSDGTDAIAGNFSVEVSFAYIVIDNS